MAESAWSDMLLPLPRLGANSMTDDKTSPVIEAASSDAEREAIYRFRYRVYVEEMNRYRSIADHDGKRLVEPDDAQSHLYYAADGEAVVGTMRLTWGGDAPFTDRHIEQYDLAPFLEAVPQDQMVIGERFMVERAYRGTDLIFRLFCSYLQFVNERRIQLIFGDSEPHLLNLYQGLGFRTYSGKNVNSPETGYLIPLVMVPEDLDYMRTIKSPLCDVLQDFGEAAQMPACVPNLIEGGGAVTSQRLTARDAYWRDIKQALDINARKVQLFDGLSEDQALRCIGKSNLIECRRGDRLIKRGNVAQNMFVVVSGTLEVRDDEGDVVSWAGAGDIVGEMAFFLKSPRSMDVYAATDDVRVLSLSESVIKTMIEEDSTLAATLLLNVSKMLCYKLLNQA